MLCQITMMMSTSVRVLDLKYDNFDFSSTNDYHIFFFNIIMEPFCAGDALFYATIKESGSGNA